MPHPPQREARPLDARQICLRLGAIGAIVLASGAAFAYVCGWLDPQRLTPDRVVDVLEANSGGHAGYRRNHANGGCAVGHLESNGAAAAMLTVASLRGGTTPGGGGRES